MPKISKQRKRDLNVKNVLKDRMFLVTSNKVKLSLSNDEDTHQISEAIQHIRRLKSIKPISGVVKSVKSHNDITLLFTGSDVSKDMCSFLSALLQEEINTENLPKYVINQSSDQESQNQKKPWEKSYFGQTLLYDATKLNKYTNNYRVSLFNPRKEMSLSKPENVVSDHNEGSWVESPGLNQIPMKHDDFDKWQEILKNSFLTYFNEIVIKAASHEKAIEISNELRTILNENVFFPELKNHIELLVEDKEVILEFLVKPNAKIDKLFFCILLTGKELNIPLGDYSDSYRKKALIWEIVLRNCAHRTGNELIILVNFDILQPLLLNLKKVVNNIVEGKDLIKNIHSERRASYFVFEFKDSRTLQKDMNSFMQLLCGNIINIPNGAKDEINNKEFIIDDYFKLNLEELRKHCVVNQEYQISNGPR